MENQKDTEQKVEDVETDQDQGLKQLEQLEQTEDRSERDQFPVCESETDGKEKDGRQDEMEAGRKAEEDRKEAEQAEATDRRLEAEKTSDRGKCEAKWCKKEVCRLVEEPQGLKTDQQDLYKDRVVKWPEGGDRVGQGENATECQRQTETDLGEARFPERPCPKIPARPDSGHEREHSATSFERDDRHQPRKESEASQREIEKDRKDQNEDGDETKLGHTEKC